MDADTAPRLAYLLLLLVAVASWFFVQGRGSAGRMLQQAAIWALIFLGLIAAIALWPDIRSAVAPRQSLVETARGTAVEVPLGIDGHYHLTLLVNGVPVIFTLDTGATDLVLSQRDAASAGIDPASLAFLGQAMTANGPVRTARVTLDTVELEGIVDRDVSAVVTEGPLESSLLGMTYLSRFARIEIEGGRLLLIR
ncbi:TIGR02281 family clan AA aspartic protease [Rubellimicrobium sp. CFH 75288]|uniref:retropepsin-like aspartic protease family protein n=1 Tax=Rubellimicrobium sp. CFH 75288 TaxID=2697034 RepID=UPI0014128B99|nr:TIGR02281 family clan AA aspartic protease [Rubellimicrobium sp. CFH 75288]NAZ36092.1 TIGR02281 family clan AA aspartic protease [Rubellimicrobium sp. CFH 75288]